jgi:hypothetical protein
VGLINTALTISERQARQSETEQAA